MREHPPSPGNSLGIINISAPFYDGTATATNHPVLAGRGRVLRVRHCNTFGTGHDCPVGATAVPAGLLGIFL